MNPDNTRMLLGIFAKKSISAHSNNDDDDDNYVADRVRSPCDDA